uniref:Uncharacterized protein n=1 Tax=Zooxanthella nutricula TaxID=1333877 RepID=A0A7S2LJR3_9DINO
MAPNHAGQYNKVKDGSDIPTVTGLKVRRRGYQAYRRFKKACSRAKRRAKAALLDLTGPMRKSALLAIKEALKASLADDPDMCHVAQVWVRQCVDDLWQDVEREIETVIEDARHGVVTGSKAWKDVETLRSMGEPPPAPSLSWLRAKVLYIILPFDKSIFGTLRDPWYWPIFLISMWPDARCVYYALLILLISVPGPPDEFQLVQFILNLKATQFLGSGIVLAFMGGMQYYMCVEEGMHTCDTSGPGSYTSPALTVFDCVGSALLIWVSFLLLPYSKPAAGLRQHADIDANAVEHEEGDDEAEECSCCENWCACSFSQKDSTRGGRLSGLLQYDLSCFILSSVFLVCICWKHYTTASDKGFFQQFVEHISTWQFQATLYWTRVFYSLLAMPFFVFNLPILSSILTHTVPTGFNPNGKAVTRLLPPIEEEDVEDHASPARDHASPARPSGSASSWAATSWMGSPGGRNPGYEALTSPPAPTA